MKTKSVKKIKPRVVFKFKRAVNANLAGGSTIDPTTTTSVTTSGF